MNPNGLDTGSKNRRQLPDDSSVLVGLRLSGRNITDLRIDLNLYRQSIVIPGVEQIGIDHDPGLDPPIVHHSFPSPGIRHAHERSRI